MNEEIMIRHYEKTPKETLIKILVASREQVEKLQKRNKECKQEIERLNNIINELENYFNKIKDTSTLEERMIAKYMLKYIKELKGDDKE